MGSLTFYCPVQHSREIFQLFPIFQRSLLSSNKILLLSTILNNKSTIILDKPLYYLAITISVSQQTHQCWYLVENESWADVHLSTLFQRWQNNVETTLTELRRFNIDEPTLFQPWNLVENESWANICLSTLFQRWQNNVETTLIELRWFNVGDSMLFQRWY